MSIYTSLPRNARYIMFYASISHFNSSLPFLPSRCCYLSGLSHFDLSIDLDPPSCKGAEGYVDSRLTLDLFPLLRRMAKDEELKQREHMRQEEAGSQAEYRGRATRARKKNGPLHYFSVCANSNSIEEHEGRKLGENLVKLALC